MRGAFPSGNRELEDAFSGRQPRPADFNKSPQKEKRPKGKPPFALRLREKDYGDRWFVGLAASVESVFLGRGRRAKEEDAQGKKR